MSIQYEKNTKWKQVMRDCNIRVTYAVSPQAKGKIERPYGWLQDRLVRTCVREEVADIREAQRVLAHHLLHTIRFKLRQRGVRLYWTTTRQQLSTQVRVTTTMKREDGKVIRIRKSSKAEPSHQAIYDASDLTYQPGKTVKTIL